MKPNELLNKAKSEFVKEYGKAHDQMGYTQVLQWKNTVPFAKKQREISAYIKTKKLIKMMLYSFIINLSVILVGFFSYANCGPFNKPLSILLLIMLAVFIVFCIWFYLHGLKLIRLNEAVCKGKVIIYQKD